MYTENEAKRKVCKLTSINDGTGIRIKHINCVGPLCMKWRWILKCSTNEELGFCGLAGWPQNCGGKPGANESESNSTGKS